MKNDHDSMPLTAGMPLRWLDWIGGKGNLPAQLSKILSFPSSQIEASGTAALIVALKTLSSADKRKNVIIPAYTSPLVALAIAYCGLQIKICDVSYGYFDFDFKQLAKLADENTLAIIATHLGGRIADVASVKAIAEPHHIFVIENADHALGAEVGQLGDITFYSLAAGKGLTLYKGGLLTTINEALRQGLQQTSQQLVNTDNKLELKQCLALFRYTSLYQLNKVDDFYHQIQQWNLQLGDITDLKSDELTQHLLLHKVGRLRQSVAGNALKRFPDFLIKTRLQALIRVQKLRHIPCIEVITDADSNKGVWPFIMVLMPDAASRDQLLLQMGSNRFGISQLFTDVIPEYTMLKEVVPKAEIPNARDLAERLFIVSNSLWLSNALFDNLCNKIRGIIIAS